MSYRLPAGAGWGVRSGRHSIIRPYGFRAIPPKWSRNALGSTGSPVTPVGCSGRHVGTETNPGSIHSSPSKKLAISSGYRFQ